ncbi:MAG: cation transporter [Eubacteriales bacterium]|nr:cation transporter [Eubacteriales bacterium]
MQTIVIQVEGMSCAHCQRAVTNALSACNGVSDAVVSLEHKNATVTYDPGQVTPDELRAAIREEGYEAT